MHSWGYCKQYNSTSDIAIEEIDKIKTHLEGFFKEKIYSFIIFYATSFNNCKMHVWKKL